MSSNKSIAVWCVPHGGQTGVRFEVHFNYWRMSDRPPHARRFWRTGAPPRDFAEIGVMVEDVRLVERISIYIPTALDARTIHDCSPLFSEKDVVQGIFNEVLDVEAADRGPLVLRRASGRVFCRMHRFAVDAAGTGIVPEELSIERFEGGTSFAIRTPALQACSVARSTQRAYFRLRLEMPIGKDGNPFVEDVEVYDRVLLSGYDQIEYLDFRLNEARTLPTAVEERMAREQPAGSAELATVAFLTAVPVSAEISVANSEFHKMRLLEYPIWSAYAPGLPRGMVVYHWKRTSEKKPIVDFSAFVKLQMRRSGRDTMIRYLLIAFAFGVLGNLFAGWVQDPVDQGMGSLWNGVRALAARLASAWLEAIVPWLC